MTGDRVIRFVTALAVLAVAVIAAIVSYSHIYDLGRTHGQDGTAARLLPLSVDGLILAASLVLLLAARNHQRAPALPRFALWAGIGSTVAANLAYGVPYGPVGTIVPAWPGLAFVLAVEILLGMLRRSGTPTGTHEVAWESVTEAVPEAASSRTRPAAARPLSNSASRRRGVRVPEVLFAAEIEAGTLPSVRAIKRQCRVGQDRAVVIRDQLAARMSDVGETIEATA